MWLDIVCLTFLQNITIATTIKIIYNDLFVIQFVLSVWCFIVTTLPPLSLFIFVILHFGLKEIVQKEHTNTH